MKRLVLMISLFYCSLLSLAQTDSVYYGVPEEKAKKERKERKEWLDQLNYGGNLQLFFGNVTFIYLNPTVGFNPVEKLNLGIGGVYSYLGSAGYSTSMYGPQGYARYAVTEYFSLVGQYDKLYQPDWRSINPEKKVWVDYMLAGIAYNHKVGDKATFSTSLLYNFTPHRSSIYLSNFVFQFGFNTRI